MRLFVDSDVEDFLLKSGIADSALCEMANTLSQGSHDGELVKELLYKKRVGGNGRGARDSARALVGHSTKIENIFLLKMYEKNSPPNRSKKGKVGKKEIHRDVIESMSILAKSYLISSKEQLKNAVDLELLREVNCGQ